jgi:hypothetical protein
MTGENAKDSRQQTKRAQLRRKEYDPFIVVYSHMDAVLRQEQEAQRLWVGDLEAKLAQRRVDVIAHKS